MEAPVDDGFAIRVTKRNCESNRCLRTGFLNTSQSDINRLIDSPTNVLAENRWLVVINQRLKEDCVHAYVRVCVFDLGDLISPRFMSQFSLF